MEAGPFLGPIRFIPAFAGNGFVHWTLIRSSPVHPRVRGERHHLSYPDPQMIGSSPRSRGTGVKVRDALKISRFIPAFAGNGFELYGSERSLSVHPRVRGERRASRTKDFAYRGSSPRSRGTGADQPDRCA